MQNPFTLTFGKNPLEAVERPLQQNEKSLTFLYRAPKIPLKPLNRRAIIAKYRSIFLLSEEQAEEMAELIRGYVYFTLPLFDKYVEENG